MDTHDPDGDLQDQRESTFNKFEAHWQSIIDKYSAYDFDEESEENDADHERGDIEDELEELKREKKVHQKASYLGKDGAPDILDLRTGTLVRDNGHIKSLLDADSNKDNLWVFEEEGDDNSDTNEDSGHGYPKTPTKSNSNHDKTFFSPSRRRNSINSDSDDSLRSFKVSPKKQRLTRSAIRGDDNLRITPTRQSSPIPLRDTPKRNRPILLAADDPLKFKTSEYVVMPDGSIEAYSDATVSVNYDVRLSGRGTSAIVSGNNVNPSKTRRFLKALEKSRDKFYTSDDDRSFRLKALLLKSRKKKLLPPDEVIKSTSLEANRLVLDTPRRNLEAEVCNPTQEPQRDEEVISHQNIVDAGSKNTVSLNREQASNRSLLEDTEPAIENVVSTKDVGPLGVDEPEVIELQIDSEDTGDSSDVQLIGYVENESLKGFSSLEESLEGDILTISESDSEMVESSESPSDETNSKLHSMVETKHSMRLGKKVRSIGLVCIPQEALGQNKTYGVLQSNNGMGGSLICRENYFTKDGIAISPHALTTKSRRTTKAAKPSKDRAETLFNLLSFKYDEEVTTKDKTSRDLDSD